MYYSKGERLEIKTPVFYDLVIDLLSTFSYKNLCFRSCYGRSWYVF